MFRHALLFAFLLAQTSLISIAADATAAPRSPEFRCNRQTVRSMGRLLRADLRLLNRCLESPLGQDADSNGKSFRACAPLTASGSGIDRADLHARHRIDRACEAVQSPTCDMPLTESRCPTLLAHCLALTILEAVTDDPWEQLIARAPELQSSDLGMIPGYGLRSCYHQAPTSTTTSTTSSTTSTTAAASTSSTTTTTQSSTPRPPWDVKVSEFMANPSALSDGDGEYIELVNLAPWPVDLEGLVLRDDGSDSFSIDDPTPVPANGRLILARTQEAADALVDISYGSAITLANGADEIELVWQDTVIDRVAYGSDFAILAGRSSERIDPEQPGSRADNWCSSDAPMQAGDFGTPAQVRGLCLP